MPLSQHMLKTNIYEDIDFYSAELELDFTCGLKFNKLIFLLCGNKFIFGGKNLQNLEEDP